LPVSTGNALSMAAPVPAFAPDGWTNAGFSSRYWPDNDQGIGDGTNGAPNEFNSQGEFHVPYSGGLKVANCRQCCSYENEACGYNQNGGQYN
jgi:hypothetical protein